MAGPKRPSRRADGSYGRLPTPIEILKRRGSASVRKKEPAALLVPEVDPGDPPKIPKSASAWSRLLQALPGFDPFRDAGDCTFDRDAARSVIRFFHEELRHFKGDVAGQPFYLERWQMSLVANLFGWIRPDGYRRFRTVFLLAGRKNGKTPLAAGIVLFLLFEDGEAGAEIYSAGREYKQGAKVFEYAHGMLVQNAALFARCKLFTGPQNKAIQLGAETGFSTFRPVQGNNPDALYSFNTSAAVIDEVHALPDRRLVDAIETSTANRKQPIVIYLTTADFEREDSICNDRHDYARSVRDDGGDPTLLPVIFEADEKDDVRRVTTWKKANPNLGVSVSLDFMRTKARKAHNDPAFRNTFKRVHLCIRTRAAELAVPAEAWKRCAEAEFDPEELKGRRCFGGLDLASTTATNALALLFPWGEAFRALVWFWMPLERIRDLEAHGQPRDRLWLESGLVRGIPGDQTDYSFIRRDLNEIGNDYLIEELAVDRLYQGAQLCTDLAADGFDVIAFGQGFYSMAAPTARFLELVGAGHFHHGGNPVLTYHATNMSVEIDAAGNMKPHRGRRRLPIDGAVSCIMALGRAMLEGTSDDGDAGDVNFATF